LQVANLFRVNSSRSFGDNITKSTRNKGSLISENDKNQALRYTANILPDIWELFKEVRTNEQITSQFPKTYVKDGQLQLGSSLLIMNGLRYLFEINNNNYPVKKSDYSMEAAIEVAIKTAKAMVKEIRKNFADFTPEVVCRSDNFRNYVELFAFKQIAG
jgi:hypothetical protein